MTPTPPPADRAELPPLHPYAVLCLAALGALLVVELQRGIKLTTPLLMAVGLAGVALRLRGGPILLLVTLAAGHGLDQYHLSGFGWHWLEQPHAFQATDVILCGAVLLYVAAQYRLQALTRLVFPPDPRRRGPLPGGTGKQGVVRYKRSAALATAEEAALLLLLVPVPPLLAQACWLALARPWRVVGLPHPVGRLLLLAWVLVVGGAVVAALLGHWRARRMSAAEAALHLQDTLWQQTRREQRRLNRWLAWARLRRKEGP